MLIRPFRDSDRSAVIDLWNEVGLVVPWNDPEKDIARKLSVDPTTFFVGEVGEQLMAALMVGYDGHRGWVNYLAVSPSHRRRGYASQLMAHAESVLLAAGCPKLNLQIRGTNTQVIRFYEALGYTDDHAVSMGKRLIPDL